MRVYILNFILLALALWGGLRTFDPLNTALPFGTSDLSSVRDKLDKLGVEERQLVEGYVTRSGGDYLPGQFADPEFPLTAKNFREAIALQKSFLAKWAEQDKQAAAMRAEDDKKYAPLRKAVAIKLVRREILARGDAMKQPHQTYFINGKYVQRTPDETPILVSTYVIHNQTEDKIEMLTGGITVRKARRSPTELGILSSCFFTYDQGLAPGDSAEVACAFWDRKATRAERDYIAIPMHGLMIEWAPTEIVFASGKKLNYVESPYRTRAVVDAYSISLRANLWDEH